MKTVASWSVRFWPVVVPIVGIVLLVAVWAVPLGPALVALVAIVLAGTVLAAVQHAEVVAHKVGEPFGSLVLAVAVTVIEVALIVTLMTSGKDTPTLARDTVFSAVMITMNGIVGLSLLLGASRRTTTSFNAEGTGAMLATVTALATLTLVLPTFTAAPGPQFSPAQLVFAAIASVALYAMFVFTQTVAHRDFFLPVKANGTAGRRRRRARRRSQQPARRSQSRPAGGRTGRRRRAGEARVAVDRGRGRGDRVPEVVRRRRDRAAGAAAGRDRCRQGGHPGTGCRPA